MTSQSPQSNASIPLLDLRAQYASIADEIRAAIEAPLASQHWILGAEGAALERELAQLSGARFGVGVSSGTDALMLALHAAGVAPGDDVAVPAFTFIATASAVSALGARPVLLDIEPATFAIDPTRIESRLTPRTKAIIAVHLFGHAADMDPILEIAKRRGIPVIEDNAQSIGAIYRGRKTGSMGAFGCLSFYPTKNLGGYGDGGMILTNSESDANRLRRLRNHGQEGRYSSSERGWNSRLDEIQAAILRVKLRHLAAWTAARRMHARHYGEQLGELQGIRAPQERRDCEHVYSVYTIRVEGCVERRDRIQKFLAARRISSMIYYPLPIHLQPAYAALGVQRGELPESERAADEVLSLPMYPELTEDQITRVATALAEAAPE
ncbi:MAG TPA: DegT/DnrJ/EryC1/StrS family aminotransferase [Methylomirabilota bacterium]|nr:DegT/DnrJ/EryC1/StrS family aminotransferase [Methylomirabilota bacterium]